jgi:hypothetical protein
VRAAAAEENVAHPIAAAVEAILMDTAPLPAAIFALGTAGGLAAVAAAILTVRRARAALWVGALATLLGAACATSGGLRAHWMRMLTDAETDIDAQSPIQAEQVRRAGYREARNPAALGLLLAAVPLAGGVAAMFAGRKRRAATGAPRQSASVPIGATVLGVASAGFAVTWLAAPLPGREFPVGDASWEVLEDVEVIQQAEEGSAKLDRACARLDQDLAGIRTAPTPDLPAAIRRCGEDRIARAVLQSPLFKVQRDLEGVATSRLARRDPEVARLVKRDLDEVARMMAEPPIEQLDDDGLPRRRPAQVRMGRVEVSGKLPPEVVQRIVRQHFGRFRLCYDHARNDDPSLRGRIAVRFVVEHHGAVRNPALVESDVKHARMVDCVVNAFRAIPFPEPEEGRVRVLYPIEFTPPDVLVTQR